MNYKRHRNALTSLMRTTERRYNEDQLELNKNDLRKVWKIMKDVIGKINYSRKQDLEILVDGSTTKDPEKIVNTFNEYFVDVGPNLASRIKSDVNPISYISADSKKSIFIPYITEYEIATILSGVNNSSPGWDNIPSLILKQFIKKYIKPLTYVINKSFESGRFPCDVSPFDLYILSGFANQLSCLVIFSLPFFGNHSLLFNRVNVLLTYILTGFKSAE